MSGSSSQQLYEAVQLLTSNYNGNEELGLACRNAITLSRIFSNVNTGLHDGWATTCDFAEKIDAMIIQTLRGLQEVIGQFSIDTIEDETIAAQAAEDANSLADSILEELGWSDDFTIMHDGGTSPHIHNPDFPVNPPDVGWTRGENGQWIQPDGTPYEGDFTNGW